jgi:phage shock protein PspC (stress-responsive transcriptional regulator)
MNKVVTISLGGNACQLVEAVYEALRAYLDDARAKLAGNPDTEEIVRDLETAIAEKLKRLMGAHRSVASDADVRAALEEMGPVDGTATEGARASSEHSRAPYEAGTRRFYRIREGSVVGGVCKGLAVYFGIDVVLVRLGFVALTVVTGGGWIFIYFLFMVFVPHADTPEKLSRAEGIPWNAQEILQRAREGIEELKKSHERHKERHKRSTHDMRQYWKQERHRIRYEAKLHAYAQTHTYRRRSLIEDLVQLAILAAIVWAVYAFVPGTHAFYDRVGADIQQGWAWLNTQAVR